jgi:seryl-tRNA synthetase
MHTHRCLASIAKLELDALVQDTKIAIDGLQRQRESVAQAVESVQTADERSGQTPDEVLEQAERLVHSLNRLDAALNQVMGEIKQIKKIPPTAEPIVALPLRVAWSPNNNHNASMADINLREVSQTLLNSPHSGNK